MENEAAEGDIENDFADDDLENEVDELDIENIFSDDDLENEAVEGDIEADFAEDDIENEALEGDIENSFDEDDIETIEPEIEVGADPAKELGEKSLSVTGEGVPDFVNQTRYLNQKVV